MAKKQDEKQKR